MNFFERIDCFQFDDYFFFDEKIETMLSNLVIAIEKRNGFLTNEGYSSESKLYRQCLFVD